MASVRDATSPPLSRYRKMRDFQVTREPSAANTSVGLARLDFVIQKHWASRLHYDSRLELDGVLASWAVPKGPCYDPKEKRMTVHVEDHPVEYSTFDVLRSDAELSPVDLQDLSSHIEELRDVSDDQTDLAFLVELKTLIDARLPGHSQ